MTDSILKLKEMVCSSDNIVFFGGAGVSTESGIPDFRSVDGLYNQKYKYPPEQILSRSFFEANPEEFFRFYREKLVFTDVKPNAAHFKLAELERAGKLKAVITQNVDGLHREAGSKNVLELHGSRYRGYCTRCGKNYPGEHMINAEGVPLCDCGATVRPDVVLFEESLNDETLRAAIRCISEADVMIVGGTSLAVYPAAGLVNYYKGDKLALINRDPTPYDKHADIVIHDSIGHVFSQI